MKGSLVKLNFVSTLVGKAQIVVFYLPPKSDFSYYRKKYYSAHADKKGRGDLFPWPLFSFCLAAILSCCFLLYFVFFTQTLRHSGIQALLSLPRSGD
jgi:amino acid transporter